MAVASGKQTSSVYQKGRAITERDAAYEKALAEVDAERAAAFNDKQMIRNSLRESSQRQVDYLEAKKDDALAKALKARGTPEFRALVKDATTYESAYKTAVQQRAALLVRLDAEEAAGVRDLRRGREEEAHRRVLAAFEKKKTALPSAAVSTASSTLLGVPRAFLNADGSPRFPIKQAEVQRIAVSGSEQIEDSESLKTVQGRAPVYGYRLRNREDFAKLIRYIQTEQDEAALGFAWTIVATTVWRPLVSAAMRLTKNESDANTLAGATIAAAYETIGGFDVDREARKNKSRYFDDAFAGWLIRAAQRDFIDERRKLGRLESDQRFESDDESDGEFVSVYEDVSTDDPGAAGLKYATLSSFGSILQAESEDTIRDIKRVLRRIATDLDSGREKVQAFKMWAFNEYTQDQIGKEFPTRTASGEDKPLSRETVNKWIKEVLAALRQRSPEFSGLCFEGETLVDAAKQHGPVWQQQRKAAAKERQAIRRGEIERAENPRRYRSSPRLRNPSFAALPASLARFLTSLTR